MKVIGITEANFIAGTAKTKVLIIPRTAETHLIRRGPIRRKQKSRKNTFGWDWASTWEEPSTSWVPTWPRRHYRITLRCLRERLLTLKASTTRAPKNGGSTGCPTATQTWSKKANWKRASWMRTLSKSTKKSTRLKTRSSGTISGPLSTRPLKSSE